MNARPLRLGVAGLGRGFMLMLQTLAHHPRVQLVAAADPRPEARSWFVQDFGGTAHASVAALCADPAVEAVYVATPHEHHVEHVLRAAGAGKHVLVEKPMALTLPDCRRMIDAARTAGVRLMVGHSHSLDAPYLRARKIIDSGAYGQVRMITALNFTDFLYRPRRAEELDTIRGGGVVFSQAAHHVDIVRLLGGGRVRTVRAATGAWDRARPTEGAYSALLSFEDGAFATLTYSGYAHFDTDAFAGWIGELGQPRDPRRYGEVRARLRQDEEIALKNARAYGVAAAGTAEVKAHNHFGLIIISCERADLRPTPHGVEIYADDAVTFDSLPPPEVPRAEVIDAFYAAIREGQPIVHSGEWGLATMEVCLAMLESAKTGRELSMRHQRGLLS